MRKYLIICLSLLILGCSKYPTSKSTPYGYYNDRGAPSRPFQILYGSKARKLGDSVEVSRYQFVGNSDLIRLEKSGYIILVHYTGLFLEFENDTLIDVSLVHNQIANQLNLDTTKIWFRPNLATLFTKSQIRKARANAVGSFYCDPTDELYFTHSSGRTEISVNDPKLCIRWESLEPTMQEHSYSILIRNIFDENIDTIRTKDKTASLDLSVYKNDEGLFILKVYRDDDLEFSTRDIGVVMKKENLYWPKSCEIRSAVKALEMGYFLENERRHKEAGEYYLLAKEMSERPFFKEIYEFYSSEF